MLTQYMLSSCVCYLSVRLYVRLSHAGIVSLKVKLPQMDRATCYGSNKFEIGLWELERFQTAKVTFRVIQGH